MTSLEEARAHPGRPHLRYEDLTAEPEAQARQLCEFLGLPFEPGMLDYGQFGHGRIGTGLGDASAKLKSGRIQSATLPPLGVAPGSEGFPPELVQMCATWGYSVPEAAEFSVPGRQPAGQRTRLSGRPPRVLALQGSVSRTRVLRGLSSPGAGARPGSRR